MSISPSTLPTDTICAIATAQGGAIGIIRVSGSEAITHTSAIFQPFKKGVKFDQAQAYTLTYGQIIDETEIVDEVLVSIFRAPHSYTGEDSTEISCHGSSYILQRILQLLIKSGCRMAQPGEYTQRAFLNGKLDLTQAEAVADLIASTSAATHRLAINQMRGAFSRELVHLRDKLLHFTSLMELELDFSDHEELEFSDRTELTTLADEIAHVITRLVNSFKVGNAIKNGVPVAIIGETNAGKSTLLNALVGEERAIVSDIHGTTRDVIEDTINLGGTIFRFIDTAGIRQTSDTIENLGIERTFKKIEQAQIVLWMIDATCANEQIQKLEKQILPLCKDKDLVIVVNKIDQVRQPPSMDLPYPTLYISAKSQEGIHSLQQWLINRATLPDISQSDVTITNLRHYEALTHALESIRRVQEGLQIGLTGDLISEDSRQCIHYLSEISGTITDSDVLNNIFKHFCIGK